MRGVNMNAYVREPVNALTHLGGAVLSFIALLAMLVKVSVKMPSFSGNYSCYFIWYRDDGPLYGVSCIS